MRSGNTRQRAINKQATLQNTWTFTDIDKEHRDQTADKQSRMGVYSATHGATSCLLEANVGLSADSAVA